MDIAADKAIIALQNIPTPAAEGPSLLALGSCW